MSTRAEWVAAVLAERPEQPSTAQLLALEALARAVREAEVADQ